MRFNFKADGTIIKRCDKCGREVCRLIPTGNSSTPIREEVALPYTVREEKTSVKYNGHIEHGVLEEMYYCNDCKQKGV